jgi:phosphate transport system substrate-binding protein
MDCPTRMKEPKFVKYIIAGLALAGFNSSSRAQTTEVFFVGANASQNVLYACASNLLSGVTVNISTTNSTVRDYSGTIASLGNVIIHFSLLGGIEGLQDLANQNTETTFSGSNLTPTVAVSSASPGAVGLSAAPFTILGPTLVVPYAFIKGSGLSSVSNLTQRQAAYLEGAAGTNSAGALPISFFGGTSTDPIYLVARNTASAVRTEIDANIEFTGTISTWTTNSLGQPIPDPAGGQSSGSSIRSLLKVITNGIGTVAASDISTFPTLSYEGVPYSITNVENGSYPLWGYENYYIIGSGGNGAPSPAQYQVITNLFSAVTNANFQTNSTVFVGNFAPLSGLQVTRSTDGGPITLINY